MDVLLDDMRRCKSVGACIELAMTDAYGEDEQAVAWLTCIETMFGRFDRVVALEQEVDLMGFERASDTAVVAFCRRGRRKLRVILESVQFPSLSPVEARWLKAWTPSRVSEMGAVVERCEATLWSPSSRGRKRQPSSDRRRRTGLLDRPLSNAKRTRAASRRSKGPALKAIEYGRYPSGLQPHRGIAQPAFARQTKRLLGYVEDEYGQGQFRGGVHV